MTKQRKLMRTAASILALSLFLTFSVQHICDRPAAHKGKISLPEAGWL